MTNRFPAFKRLSVTLASATALLLSLESIPTLAKDPFRSTNPHKIGDNTEAAFKAIFAEGNYPRAKNFLDQAEVSESSEPLVYAMEAVLAYDVDSDRFKESATKTRETAENLVNTDPLRGNLYKAVGLLLEGASSFKKNQNPLEAVTKVQEVFKYLDEAKKISPSDPELNLVKGYMDFLSAAYLPFSDPSEAIEQLKAAKPDYLANRGIAMGYRNMKQYDSALKYAQSALQETPNNPEAYYLIAQILFKKGEKQRDKSALTEANKNFQTALTKSSQLPKETVAQIAYEQCKTQRLIDNKDLNCQQQKEQIRKVSGLWGPDPLPPLQ